MYSVKNRREFQFNENFSRIILFTKLIKYYVNIMLHFNIKSYYKDEIKSFCQFNYSSMPIIFM